LFERQEDGFSCRFLYLKKLLLNELPWIQFKALWDKSFDLEHKPEWSISHIG